MANDFKRIVCPLDFSRISVNGLKKAADMIASRSGSLHLVHVVTDPWSEIYNPGADHLLDPVKAQEIAFQQLRSIGEKHAAGHRCEYVVLRGEHIYRTICEYAESVHADIIVLTTHGRTGPKRLIMGSVAENIIRYAKCSVLVIK